jgi:Tfp pilus assembly protein PilF
MNKLVITIILLSSGVLVSAQTGSSKLIPVTTSSKSALAIYNEAKKYYDDVKLDKALNTFKKALDEDKDFFMANYQLAIYYLMNKDQEDFQEYSEAAAGCRENLSDAEKILKSALAGLSGGKTDVTESGNKLVTMYPGDPEAYNNLIYFQTISGDIKGMVETLLKAIKITSKPAPFYNQLGYAYLSQKEDDKAEEAFDKYIELDPDNPNAYDSMGDYYMYMKKYELAYESYMKANSMDPSFSHDKAEAAKQLYERTEGKTLKIISL